MKLPSDVIGSINFHQVMIQVNVKIGCPFFAQYHVEQANKLIKMKAKVYLLEQRYRRDRMEIAKSIFDALSR